MSQINNAEVPDLMVRWSLKTCMVYGETIGMGRNYSQDDRTTLMHGTIPPNTDVQLAIMEGRGAYTGVDSAVMDLGNVRGEHVLGTLEVLYVGPIAILIRRAAQGNAFLNLLARTHHFAKDWTPLHSFMPRSASSTPLISDDKITAFLDKPFKSEASPPRI